MPGAQPNIPAALPPQLWETTKIGGLDAKFTGTYSYIEEVVGTSPFDQPVIGPDNVAANAGGLAVTMQNPTTMDTNRATIRRLGLIANLHCMVFERRETRDHSNILARL
jgi:hypothetical protein